MFLKRLALVGLAATAGLSTAACSDGYGYSGLDVGYGVSSYGYDGSYGYGDGYDGAGYGYGYGYPSSFGWSGNYYYPGAGVYVYDQYRRPYRWNDDQRRYWEGRRGNDRGYRNGGDGNRRGFDRRHDGGVGGQGYRTNPYGGRGGYGNRVPNDQDHYYNRGAPNIFRRDSAGDAGNPGYRRAEPAEAGGTTPRYQGGWRGEGNQGGWRGEGRHGRR